jgi:hypothetical protein
MNELRNFLRALLWLAALLVVQLLLAQLGASTYALPSATKDDITEWVQSTDNVTVTFSVIRVLTMAIIWYALATTVLGAILRCTPWRTIADAVDRISLPATRVLAVRLAGITAVGSLAMPVTTAHAVASSDVPVLRHLGANEPVPLTTTTTTQAPMTTTKVTTAPAPEPNSSEPASKAVAVPSPDRHVVQRGENFWTIAETVLKSSLGREPSEAELVTYWKELVQTNRHMLKQPANPDLVFSGQIITLPPR